MKTKKVSFWIRREDTYDFLFQLEGLLLPDEGVHVVGSFEELTEVVNTFVNSMEEYRGKDKDKEEER